jgi:hypothetical protein
MGPVRFSFASAGDNGPRRPMTVISGIQASWRVAARQRHGPHLSRREIAYLEDRMGFLSKARGMASGRRGTAATPPVGGRRRRRPAAGGGKGRMAGKAFKALRGRGKI